MIRKSKKIGQVYNNLKIIDSIHKGTQTIFVVKCLKCGKIQNKTYHGIIDETTSCENCGNCKKRHKGHKTVNDDIYRLYSTIIQRCKRPAYKNKNIKMCDEWFNDFEKFRTWAKEHDFKKGLTIDRIDNSKGYEPNNCRFTDWVGQANNRTTNLIIEYSGEKDTVANICKKYGKDRYLVYRRLRAGWTIEKAIEEPVNKTKWSKNYAKIRSKMD